MPNAAASKVGITAQNANGKAPDAPVAAPVFGSVVTPSVDPLVGVGVGVFAGPLSSVRWSQKQKVSVNASTSIVTFPSSARPEKSVPRPRPGTVCPHPARRNNRR